jgi:hypothetical protein
MDLKFHARQGFRTTKHFFSSSVFDKPSSIGTWGDGYRFQIEELSQQQKERLKGRKQKPS